MRVLICGSRSWTDQDAINYAIFGLPLDSIIIHGAAAGADTLADQAAAMWGLTRYPYPADWAKYGRRAGPIRNQQMLDEGCPDLVIAFRRRGPSPGTDDMIKRARAEGIPVEIHEG